MALKISKFGGHLKILTDDDDGDDGDGVVLPDDPHEEVEVGAQVNSKGSKGQKGWKTSLENEQFI